MLRRESEPWTGREEEEGGKEEEGNELDGIIVTGGLKNTQSSIAAALAPAAPDAVLGAAKSHPRAAQRGKTSLERRACSAVGSK